MKIGMIGLDTSHAVEFTRLLNDPENQHYVHGGKVTVAFPGGSPDWELSRSRVAGYTAELRDVFGVEIAGSPEEVASRCDAVLLLSADGRVHKEQFGRIAPSGRPVFIDKPLAVRSEDALEIKRIADRHAVPVMSSSSMRFAEPLVDALEKPGPISGADCYGPMPLQPLQPGLFWYGVHSVEMLYAAIGTGCRQVTRVANETFDLTVGLWGDGRIGTIRGNRGDNWSFGALLHRADGTSAVDVSHPGKPSYASLLERVIPFFATGQSAVPVRESLEIIRFMEAANESGETGRTITL